MPSRTTRCLEHPREWRYVPRLVHHIPAAIHTCSGFMALLGNQLISILINAPTATSVLSHVFLLIVARSFLDLRFVCFYVIPRLIVRLRSSIALLCVFSSDALVILFIRLDITGWTYNSISNASLRSLLRSRYYSRWGEKEIGQKYLIF